MSGSGFDSSKLQTAARKAATMSAALPESSPKATVLYFCLISIIEISEASCFRLLETIQWVASYGRAQYIQSAQTSYRTKASYISWIPQASVSTSIPFFVPFIAMPRFWSRFGTEAPLDRATLREWYPLSLSGSPAELCIEKHGGWQVGVHGVCLEFCGTSHGGLFLGLEPEGFIVVAWGPQQPHKPQIHTHICAKTYCVPYW